MFNENLPEIETFIREDTQDIWKEIMLFGPNLTHRQCQREVISDEKSWEIIEKVFLTDKKQDILRLYFWDGLTQAEIGIIFRIQRPVVTKHIAEAKKKVWRYIFRVL